MRQLSENDAEGSANTCLLREHFMHGPYLCMSFEKLSSSLRDVGKLSLDKVLAYSKQLLVALRFLHDVVGLVHCDVKPDNLLLRHDRLAVKLCDFGTARMVDAQDLQATDELQPLFYRAPEIFVGAPRGRKIDMWSAGCTIYEFITGRILFRSCTTHKEVVEQIMKLRGLGVRALSFLGLASPCFAPLGSATVLLFWGHAHSQRTHAAISAREGSLDDSIFQQQGFSSRGWQANGGG
eukprot:308968-Amphidinium_carterae.1